MVEARQNENEYVQEKDSNYRAKWLAENTRTSNYNIDYKCYSCLYELALIFISYNLVPGLEKCTFAFVSTWLEVFCMLFCLSKMHFQQFPYKL